MTRPWTLIQGEALPALHATADEFYGVADLV